MIRICAWCGQNLGTTEGDPAYDGMPTHTICHACFDRMMAEVPAQKPAPKATPRSLSILLATGTALLYALYVLGCYLTK